MMMGQAVIAANLYSSTVNEPPAGSPTRSGNLPAHNGASNYVHIEYNAHIVEGSTHRCKKFVYHVEFTSSDIS
jgi:hypothetical protein